VSEMNRKNGELLGHIVVSDSPHHTMQ
jgi:hypothetical protein